MAFSSCELKRVLKSDKIFLTFEEINQYQYVMSIQGGWVELSIRSTLNFKKIICFKAIKYYGKMEESKDIKIFFIIFFMKIFINIKI